MLAFSSKQAQHLFQLLISLHNSLLLSWSVVEKSSIQDSFRSIKLHFLLFTSFIYKNVSVIIAVETFSQQLAVSWPVMQYWVAGCSRRLTGVSLWWWPAVVVGRTHCSQSPKSQRRDTLSEPGDMLLSYDFCTLLTSVLLMKDSKRRGGMCILFTHAMPVFSLQIKIPSKRENPPDNISVTQ